MGQRRADVAHPEQAERRPLLRAAVPPGHVGRADRERAARQPEPQRADEKRLVARCPGHHPGRRRGKEHYGRIDDAAADPVGEDPERQARQRAGQHGHADEEAELGLVEAELPLDSHADDGEHGPDHEARRQSERAHDERGLARSRVRRSRFRRQFYPSATPWLAPAPRSMRSLWVAGIDQNQAGAGQARPKADQTSSAR